MKAFRILITFMSGVFFVLLAVFMFNEGAKIETLLSVMFMAFLMIMTGILFMWTTDNKRNNEL